MSLKLKLPKLNIDMGKYNEYKFETKDKQLELLPKEIQFCKKCVISNQRPRTEFDADGVCNACRYAEMKFGGGIDWEKREQELKELCDKHRSNDGSWDCVVPGSGGKDSMFVAHMLKQKYGMHPLTMTWSPFMHTDIGWQNYVNSIQSGFDGLLAMPNGILHRKLSRVALELKGDPWEAFTFGQKAWAFHVAVKWKIPLIFYGENGEIEYGGSFKNVDKPYESPEDWDELYFKGAGPDVLLKEGVKMGIFTEEEAKSSQFELYKPPSFEEIKKLSIQMHWFGYYKCWIPQENYYYVVKNTGFEASPIKADCSYTKFQSCDDRLDPFHWFTAYLKFGYNRASREACSDIRCGHITREEGVALANRYDHEFPKTYFKDFLEYLDLTEEDFWRIVDRYREMMPHVWGKIDGKWHIKKVASSDPKGRVPSYEERPDWQAEGISKKALEKSE